MPANSWELDEQNLSFSLWWKWRKRMLETVETSSIVISFSSDNETLIWVFFWSGIAERFSPAPLGIANALFIVVPSIFMPETPVGTAGSSGLPVTCLNVFTTVWYINVVSWRFPVPPPPVRNRYIEVISFGFKERIFFSLFRHQDRSKIGAAHCSMFNDLTDSRSKLSEISVG